MTEQNYQEQAQPASTLSVDAEQYMSLLERLTRLEQTVAELQHQVALVQGGVEQPL